ncbi:alpha-ribazole phosphatase [Dysgonomonas sp. 216]|uniref:alpha-ribazole phosphatase n=1 Tax=Dysgonomonas sp. 216 TaxID=2302934 RepID=UPI0013D53A84|nr:alpha-ribazole phosphatase [Dysgonomonas sp. 216]NDW17806.1 alpha-ribazole phosphatase [Dysgonomonas sp. 216]
MKLYLVRHTSVDVPKSVCYGQTDVPLKDSFENEAEIVRQKIKDEKFDIACTSPLSRCTRLAAYCGYEGARMFDRLKELNFGDWEMQEWDNIKEAEHWYNNWIDTPTKNGESFKQMYNRFSSFMDEIKKKEYNKVIAFTHGGIIACAKVYFGLVPFEEAFDNLASYGEIIEFEVLDI